MDEIKINDIKNSETTNQQFKIETEEIISKYHQIISNYKNCNLDLKLEDDINNEYSPEINFSDKKISDSLISNGDACLSPGIPLIESKINSSTGNISDFNKSRQNLKSFHNKRTSINSINSLNSLEYSHFYHSNPPLQSSLLNSFNKQSSIKGKQLYDSIIEKKNYLDKIRILSNRIKLLKDQENQINKKAQKILINAKKDEKLKKEKNESKNLVNQAKIEKISNLEMKKSLIQSKKTQRIEKLEQTKEENFKKKKEIYNFARNDKILLETMTNQFSSHVLNKNNYKYVKIKHELIEGRTFRFKKQTEKEEHAKIKFDNKLTKEKEEKEKLLQKLKQLEETEINCLESLKKTLKNKELELAMLDICIYKKGILRQSVDFKEETKFRDIDTKLKTEKKKSAKSKSVLKLENIRKNLHQNNWK